VNRGIDLLRKQGVVHNPNDLKVHKELGWIFLHKIAGYTDDANIDYKRRLATEWTEVLGVPPTVTLRDTRDQAIQKYVEWLRPINEAPNSLDELIASDPKVAELVSLYRESIDPELNSRILMLHARHSALRATGRHEAYESILKEQQRWGQNAEAFSNLMDRTDLQEAWDPVLAFVRRRVLLDKYNMEPSRMIRYTEKYGPMDWRHAAAHAVYWVAKGVEGALTRTTKQNFEDFDFLNTDRIVMHGVQELYRSGTIYHDYAGATANPIDPKITYIGMPNPHFAETYGMILDEVRARGGIYEAIEGQRDAPGRIFSLYSSGYENFMRDVIRYYYRIGLKEKATRMKDELGQWEGQNLNKASKRAEYFAQNIDDFVAAELRERLTTPQVYVSEVTTALQAAYINGLLSGDSELYRDNWNFAKTVHDYYMNEQYRKNVLNPSTGRMEQLPKEFDVVAGYAFLRAIQMVGRADAERLYDAAPNRVKRYAYDALRTQYGGVYEKEAETGGRTFDQVFPEPPGMAEHRAREAQRAQQQAQEQLQKQQR
jgi:hypothetical protein